MEDDTRAKGPGLEAIVLDLLPNATFRLRLGDRRQVLAHAVGAGQRNFVRVRTGDRVRVQLSPHDPSRGRITKVLEQSKGLVENESTGLSKEDV